MDQGTTFVKTLINTSSTTYYDFLLLIFLILPIYMSIRLIFYIIHYLKKEKIIKQTNITI